MSLKVFLIFYSDRRSCQMSMVLMLTYNANIQNKMNHMWIIVENCIRRMSKVVCTFALGHPLLWKDVMWNFICTNETRVIVLNANFCCANKPRLIWYRACPRKKLNTKGIYVIVILKSWANMDGCIRQRCQESSKKCLLSTKVCKLKDIYKQQH